MQLLSIVASGMVTGVGLNAPSTCAAIRCGINNFKETRFIDKGGEWIIGSEICLEQPWRGRTKLVKLAVSAIRQCLLAINTVETEKIPLLLCVAEQDRPERLEGLDDILLNEIQDKLGMKFNERSTTISNGRVGGIDALRQAVAIFNQGSVTYCIIAGVDTLLVADTLSAYEERERLQTSKNSNGFIPGEAGAAVLVSTANRSSGTGMNIIGIGYGKEKATVDSEEPLRAEGLVQAIKEASQTSGMTVADMDYRITDANGEQYLFKEAVLALTRTLRKRKEEFDIWHPADCIGEVGAAIVPVVLGVAMAAGKKGYALGNGVLCHFGNDDGKRAAMFLSYSDAGSA